MAIDYSIKGQAALQGTVSVKGSPLATVGILAAALLTTDKVTLTNVPHLKDIDQLLQELRQFNVMVDWTHQHEVTIHAETVSIPNQQLKHDDIAGWPASLVAALIIRARQVTIPVEAVNAYSETFLWPMLEKFGATLIVDQQQLHIQLQHLHATGLELTNATAEQTLTAIMLAVTADGQTLIDQAVVNPEIEDVIACLQLMKSDISRVDEVRLSITGQSEIVGTTYQVIMDRYEAAFWATVAIMTAGDIQINDIKSAYILPFLAKLEQMGASYTVNQPTIRVWRDRHQRNLNPLSIVAKPFPGLSEDWLLLCLPLQALANGESLARSSQPQQLSHALATLKMFGVEGHTDDQGVHVFGPTNLQAAQVQADQFTTSLVATLAGLAASGDSDINGVDSLDGRFESLAERLKLLGANITRHDSND